MDDLILSLYCPQARRAFTFSLDEKVNKKSSQSDTLRYSMGTYLPESRQIDDSRSEDLILKKRIQLLDITEYWISPLLGEMSIDRGVLY